MYAFMKVCQQSSRVTGHNACDMSQAMILLIESLHCIERRVSGSAEGS